MLKLTKIFKPRADVKNSKLIIIQAFHYEDTDDDINKLIYKILQVFKRSTAYCDKKTCFIEIPTKNTAVTSAVLDTVQEAVKNCIELTDRQLQIDKLVNRLKNDTAYIYYEGTESDQESTKENKGCKRESKVSSMDEGR